MSITVVVWNVKHFKRHPDAETDRERVRRVVDLLDQQQPDVFALMEVTGKEVFSALVADMPNHSFQITEGEQTQEILIGSRRSLQTFMTQRLEFKSGASALRPGALLTVAEGGTLLAFLFLHLKSFPDPGGFGVRTDQLERAFKFRDVLAAEAAGLGFQMGYVFAGDLNTMGMDLSFSDRDVSAQQEIRRLRTAAEGRGMRLLEKTEAATWHSDRSAKTGDLDHVVATDGLRLEGEPGPPVRVIGWPQEPDEPSRRRWVRDHSDHALLRFTVETAQ